MKRGIIFFGRILAHLAYTINGNQAADDFPFRKLSTNGNRKLTNILMDFLKKFVKDAKKARLKNSAGLSSKC
ncbi:MAG: hypothetical protein ACOYI4_10255 [Christensenellales bacterium]